MPLEEILATSAPLATDELDRAGCLTSAERDDPGEPGAIEGTSRSSAACSGAR
jgi:hypothetical protein